MSRDEIQDPTGIRYYGGDGTVHGTGHLNIERDHNGHIVSVWFRCQPLPFDVTEVRNARAVEMRSMYERQSPPAIDAVVLKETR